MVRLRVKQHPIRVHFQIIDAKTDLAEKSNGRIEYALCFPSNDGWLCACWTYASSQNVQADDFESNPPSLANSSVYLRKYYCWAIDESRWCSLLLESNGKTINNKSNFTLFLFVFILASNLLFRPNALSECECALYVRLVPTGDIVVKLCILCFCLLFGIMPSNTYSKQW